jgi:hypothetical protein
MDQARSSRSALAVQYPGIGGYEVRQRTTRLSMAMDEYRELCPLPDEPEVFLRRKRGRAEELEETILSQANHLRKALEASDVTVRFPDDLAELVRHLRNLHEHWDQHQSSFGDEALPKSQSGRWFAERYPGKSPWSRDWSERDGYVIGDALRLSELDAVIDQIHRFGP